MQNAGALRHFLDKPYGLGVPEGPEHYPSKPAYYRVISMTKAAPSQHNFYRPKHFFSGITVCPNGITDRETYIQINHALHSRYTYRRKYL